jgi:hypothetical protein
MRECNVRPPPDEPIRDGTPLTIRAKTGAIVRHDRSGRPSPGEAVAKVRAELVEKANGAGWLVSVAGTRSMLEFDSEDEARQFASEVGWSRARRAATRAVRRVMRQRGR